MSHTPETYERTCPYCGTKHTPPPHWAQNDYCSREHRLACDGQRTVGFVEREIEFNPEIHGDTIGADAVRFGDEMGAAAADVVEGLNAGQVERLSRFFEGWLNLPLPAQIACAARLAGKSNSEVAELLEVSAQATSKTIIKARIMNPVIDKALVGT